MNTRSTTSTEMLVVVDLENWWRGHPAYRKRASRGTNLRNRPLQFEHATPLRWLIGDIRHIVNGRVVEINLFIPGWWPPKLWGKKVVTNRGATPHYVQRRGVNQVDYAINSFLKERVEIYREADRVPELVLGSGDHIHHPQVESWENRVTVIGHPGAIHTCYSINPVWTVQTWPSSTSKLPSQHRR